MTLLAPLFLTGLLAIALPLLLHRMQEQNAPVESFPSNRFLEQTRRSMSRRKKLRHRLLLALRILLLAALCFLFTEPVLKLLRPLANGGNDIHLIVLDDSFSMRHGDRWNEALQQVDALVEEHGDSSDVVLRLASGELPGNRTASNAAAVDAGDAQSQSTDASTLNRNLRSQLESLKQQSPSLAAIDYALMMDDAQSFAEKQSQAVHLHVVTDAQRSAVGNGINSLYREKLASVKVYTSVADTDYNLSLNSTVTWLDARSARIDSEILLSVAAVNAAQDSSSGDAVEISVTAQGQSLGSEQIQIQPGQLVQHQMLLENLHDSVRSIGNVSGNASRALTLVVQLSGQLASDDKQPFDNQVNLALPLNKPLQVAVLPLDPISQKRDIAYLEAAFKQMYNVALSELDTRVNAVDPATRLLIVLHGQGDVSLPEAAQSYWRKGGAVLQVLAGSTDDDFTSLDTDASVAAGNPGADPVTQVNTVHPLSLDRRGWASVQLSRPLWRSADLQRLSDALSQLATGSVSSNSNVTGQGDPDDALEPAGNALSYFSDGADVLLASDAGVPVLLQPRQSQSARSDRSGDNVSSKNAEKDIALLVLTTPLDGLSTNLPVNPVFVPFMQSITDYMLNNRRYPSTLTSGSVLVLDGNTQLLTPEETPVFDIASTTGRQAHVLAASGTYTVLEQNDVHHIQVGIDPAESDISRLEDDTITLWESQYLAQDTDGLGQNGSEQSTDSDSNTVKVKSQQQGYHDFSLWRWLLPLLLVVMLFEIVFANRTFARLRGAN